MFLPGQGKLIGEAVDFVHIVDGVGLERLIHGRKIGEQLRRRPPDSPSGQVAAGTSTIGIGQDAAERHHVGAGAEHDPRPCRGLAQFIEPVLARGGLSGLWIGNRRRRERAFQLEDVHPEPGIGEGAQ